MFKQLTLQVQLRDDATFENCSIGENKIVIEQLKLSLDGRGERFFYLWGGKGVGKTHLLQGCCHYSMQFARSCAYIPLADRAQLSLQLFEQMESLRLICIDDIEAIASHQLWEEGLFHLYNKIKDSDTILIITGKQAPQKLPVLLKDLTSRLSWGMVFRVQDLADPVKTQTLIERAKSRGFTLPQPVASFMLTRCSRNMQDLFELLDRLDQATLVHQRSVTIPFVKSLLGI